VSERTDDSCGSNKKNNSHGNRGRTLNFLITGVTFKEIMLSGLGGFIGNFVSDGNLKWTGTVGYNKPIILTFVALNGGANFEKSFSVFLSLTSFLCRGGGLLDL